MKPTENQIHNLIQNLNDKTRPDLDQKILDDCRNELESQDFSIPASGPTIWSTIMRSKITKSAIAAAVVLVVVLCMTARTTPAWAMEQTIQALEHFNVVYMAGFACYPGGPREDFEIWAKPNSSDSSRSGDFRLHEGSDHVSLASEVLNLTFVYTKTGPQGTVYITEGLNRHCNPFPSSDLFRHIMEAAEDLQEDYRIDPQTGRDSVFVTFQGHPINTARYWLMQFDLETKLPVRATVWRDKERSGQPHFDITTFAFDVCMSQDMFTFVIPEDTQVIDCRKLHQALKENPNAGIAVGDLDTAEACKMVAGQYWQAVIDGDWAGIQNLRPTAFGSDREQLSAFYEANRPIRLLEIPSMNHLNDPGTFAEVTCVLQTQDGREAHSVLNIEIRQTENGKIGVVAGVIGPELAVLN